MSDSGALALASISEDALAAELARRRAERRVAREARKAAGFATPATPSTPVQHRPRVLELAPLPPALRLPGPPPTTADEAAALAELHEALVFGSTGRTLEECAQRLGCTRENVRLIEKRALLSLAKKLAALGITTMPLSEMPPSRPWAK